MSRRKDDERACSRKIRYLAEPAENGQVRPYKCPVCPGWHMTSKNRGPNSKARYRARKRAEKAAAEAASALPDPVSVQSASMESTE